MPLHLLLLTLIAQPALVIQATPTADALVAQHLEALGGAARLRAQVSRRIQYQLSGLTPFDIPVTVEQKRPALYRRESSVMGITQISAFDGRTGWKIDPITNLSTQPEALTPSEAKQMDQDAAFDSPFLDYAAKGHKVEYLGQQSLDGRPVQVLRLTLKGGEASTVYLDAQSHLALKFVSVEKRKTGNVDIETTLGDYRPVAGVLHPHLIEIAAKDGAWRMKLVAHKVEANIPLDDARFARPGSAAASKAAAAQAAK